MVVLTSPKIPWYWQEEAPSVCNLLLTLYNSFAAIFFSPDIHKDPATCHASFIKETSQSWTYRLLPQPIRPGWQGHMYKNRYNHSHCFSHETLLIVRNFGLTEDEHKSIYSELVKNCLIPVPAKIY